MKLQWSQFLTILQMFLTGDAYLDVIFNNCLFILKTDGDNCRRYKTKIMSVANVLIISSADINRNGRDIL